MGSPGPALFGVFTTTSMDNGRGSILIKYHLSKSGRTAEFQRLRTKVKMHLTHWKNDVKSTIRNSEKANPRGKEKSVVRTQGVEKLVKQQFCRSVSEVALGHCFAMSKNCGNATKPPHLILTQFIKRITYRTHGIHFFLALLGADESSAEHCGHTEMNENKQSGQYTLCGKAYLV